MESVYIISIPNTNKKDSTIFYVKKDSDFYYDEKINSICFDFFSIIVDLIADSKVVLECRDRYCKQNMDILFNTTNPLVGNGKKKWNRDIYRQIREIIPVLIKYIDNKDFSLEMFEKLRTGLSINLVSYKKIFDPEVRGYGPINRKEIYNDNIVNSDNYLTVYECKDLKEATFAILHQYILNGYKITKCKYCEKYFITISLKKEYCQRGSTVKINKRKKYGCEETVRVVKKRLQRRKIGIEHAITGRKNYTDDKLFEFKKSCDKHLDIIQHKPTVENLNNYEAFLYSESMPHRKRKEERI